MGLCSSTRGGLVSLLNNLLAYFKMEDNSNDEVASADGTDTAITYSLANGKILKGAGFNGSTSKIAMTVPDMTLQAAMSVNIWFKTSDSGEQAFYTQGKTDTTTPLFLLEIGNVSGKIRWFHRDDPQTGIVNLSSTASTYADGAFHMVTFVKESASIRRLYIDGSLDVSDISNNPGTTTTNTKHLGMLQHTSNIIFLTGALDEIGFWDKGLSAPDVSKLWNGGNGLTYPFIVGTGNMFLVM